MYIFPPKAACSLASTPNPNRKLRSNCFNPFKFPKRCAVKRSAVGMPPRAKAGRCECFRDDAALCELLSYALIRLVEISNRSLSDDYRAHYFTIIHNLPVVSRSLLLEARSNESFEILLWYERVLTNNVDPSFYLDGVPKSIDTFDDNTTLELPAKLFKFMKHRDIMEDRQRTASKLANFKTDSERMISLCDNYSVGLPTHVSRPARFLLARVRAFNRNLAQRKPASQFRHCANLLCARRFYVGAPNERLQGECLVDADDEEPNSDAYWTMVSGARIDDIPDCSRFCCRACARQHRQHLVRLMPDYGIDLDVDNTAKKRNGLARVSESFKLCTKRNEKAARQLRMLRSQDSTLACAVSREEVSMRRKERITALNVDLGMLYSASVLSECPELCGKKLLPGAYQHWRTDHAFFAKALPVVTQLHQKYYREHGIISSLLAVPEFIEQCESMALRMF